MDIPIGSGSGGIGTASVQIVARMAYGDLPAIVVSDKTYANANSPCSVLTVDAHDGTATTIPTGAVLALVVPPADSVAASTVTLDSGESRTVTNEPELLPVGSATTITVAGAIAAKLHQLIFF